MIIYLLKRIAGAAVVLWAIITITFGLMHAIPGGPFTQEKKLPPAVMENIEARYHLNDPLWKQYADYVGRAAVLDLGPSYKYPGRTVNDIIAETFPVSAALGCISLCLAVGVGVAAGLAAAWYKNRWLDYALMLGATFGVSVPSFIIAALLVQLFAFTWPVLPAAMWKGPSYVILPALALAAHPTAFVMRLTRSSVLDALGQDYIRTARSRGAGKFSLLCRHALRNALIPIITVLAPLIVDLMTGSLVVEKIFAIPGVGSLLVTAIQSNDYNVVIGLSFIYSAMYIGIMLVVDLLYGIIDPRIRLAKGDD